jgi:hypothetical protein
MEKYELTKDTAMITSTELIRSKSDEEVYDYLFEVESFLTFFEKKSQYLDIDMNEYEATGGIVYITDYVFSDIADEVERINSLTTSFWGELCSKYLISFHQFYQDCEEVATDILKEINKILFLNKKKMDNNNLYKTTDLSESTEQPLTIPVVSGNYYWVKLMTDDKHEPAMAVNLLGVMNFKFFNGVAVPCDKVNDYSECNYC